MADPVGAGVAVSEFNPNFSRRLPLLIFLGGMAFLVLAALLLGGGGQ